MYKWLIVLDSLDQLSSHDDKNIVVGKIVMFPDWIWGDEILGEDAGAIVDVFLLKDFNWKVLHGGQWHFY